MNEVTWRQRNISGYRTRPATGIISYFAGNDPQKWLTAIPTYGKVIHAGIYPGSDLVFYEAERPPR